MEQKTMAIVAIAVVIVIVVAGAAYWMLSSGDNGGPEPTPTPTPTPMGIEGATSLQFSVDITGGTSEGSYKYYAKNIGTDDMRIRLEIPVGEMELVYIVNGAEQKAWANEGTGWVDLSTTFSDQWNLWEPTWQAYADNLATWTTGEWTYTEDGSEVRIYDIIVNGSLADSLFEVET